MNWIKCIDRLPNKYNKYLVIVKRKSESKEDGHCHNLYRCMWWGIIGWEDIILGNEYVVTHWMPLPEPPKED